MYILVDLIKLSLLIPIRYNRFDKKLKLLKLQQSSLFIFVLIPKYIFKNQYEYPIYKLRFGSNYREGGVKLL